MVGEVGQSKNQEIHGETNLNLNKSYFKAS